MQIHSTPVRTTLGPVAELDRLGDEIAELSAHLEAASARLLDLHWRSRCSQRERSVGGYARMIRRKRSSIALTCSGTSSWTKCPAPTICAVRSWGQSCRMPARSLRRAAAAT